MRVHFAVTTCALLWSLLFMCAISRNLAPCIYNSTHCACSELSAPGKCLHMISDGLCSVKACSLNGVTCDCLGTMMCKIETCSRAIPVNGTLPTSLELGGTASCVMSDMIQCVKRMDNVAAAASTTETVEPVQYRQVQFGQASASHMFNVTSFVDSNNVILPEKDMHKQWPDHERLRNRFIHVRVYENAERSETFLCAIYNGYTWPSDGLGNGATSVQIEGLSGQTLSWRACDDSSECTGAPAPTLSAQHVYVDNLSDGWCVSPLERNGNGIRVAFSEVNGMYGIEFQSLESETEYLWADPPQYGMIGGVDSNGFSVGGSASFIINLNGIPLP